MNIIKCVQIYNMFMFGYSNYDMTILCLINDAKLTHAHAIDFMLDMGWSNK